MELEGMLAQEEMIRKERIKAFSRQLDIVNVCEGNVGKAFALASDDAVQIGVAMAADDRNIGMGISSSSAETWTLLGNMARQLEHNRDFTFFPSSGTLDESDMQDMTPIVPKTAEANQENAAFNSPRKYDCDARSIAPFNTPNPKKIADMQKSFPQTYEKAKTYAEKHGLNVEFFRAMIAQESSGKNLDPKCPYSKGCTDGQYVVGAGQMMVETAQRLKCARNGQDLKDLDTNLNCSAMFLKQLYTRFGNNYLAAVAAYNAGPGMIDCYKQAGENAPPNRICNKGRWKYKETYCHTLYVFGVPLPNLLDGTQYQVPLSEGSVLIDVSEPKKPNQPVTKAELKRFAETERTLGIGDKISITTFFDFVAQRAISQDYLARISSIGNDVEETDDEYNESLGALYGEILRLLSWKFILMADMRKTHEINNLLKSLKLVATYNSLNKKSDYIIK